MKPAFKNGTANYMDDITDSAGHYTIKTIRPAPYPNNSIPAHIHSAVKIPDNSMLYINDFVFADDPLIDEEYKSSFERQDGGTGIMELIKIDNVGLESAI